MTVVGPTPVVNLLLQDDAVDARLEQREYETGLALQLAQRVERRRGRLARRLVKK